MHVFLSSRKPSSAAIAHIPSNGFAAVLLASAAVAGACNGGLPTVNAGGSEATQTAMSTGAQPNSSTPATGGEAGMSSDPSTSGGTSGIGSGSGGSAAVDDTATVGGTGGSNSAGTNVTATGGANLATGGWNGVHVAATSVKKFVGNITTGYRGDVDYNGMTFSRYWDQVTPENAGKWASVQSSATAAFNWSTLDAIYQYAQTNNIIFKEHTFVWGKQQPTGTLTQADVENWIKTFCERYPNTRLIDVVNEPPPHTTPSYMEALGTGESGTYAYITRAFKLAARYCGDAILILNDYSNIEYSADLDRTVDIVKQVTAAGAPIDAVGAQAHAADEVTATDLQNNLELLHAQTGLPIYITEYDIGDTSDSGQLAMYQAHFPVFWNASYVRGITLWGWIYGKTWIEGSGLVNGTEARPAMTWLMQTLQRPVPPN